MTFKKWGAGLLVALAASISACANEGEDRQAGGGGGTADQAQQGRDQGVRSAQVKQASAEDREFIDEMTPHHQMGVMMAEDALKKAKHPELRAFAQKTMADQRKDIAELKKHRRHLFGSVETPPMDHDQMTHVPAGANFDVKWAQSMIQHHQQAIDNAKETLDEAQAPEVKEMARMMIEKQTKEQQELRRKIAAWSAK